MVSVDDFADEAYFVIPAYVLAFGPWIYYSAIDHVDSRWRPISRLQGQTQLALLLCTVGVAVLAFYVTVQFLFRDWKEAMAALLVMGGTFFPIQRSLRQLWILKANAALERMICSTFGTWQPRNSHMFFDNDSPGEGMTDISLWTWLRGARDCFKSERNGSRALTPALEKGTLLKSLESHWNEFHKKIEFNPELWKTKLEYEMRMISGGPDGNGILRSLWLYENLVDEHQTLTNIIRLGLAVATVDPVKSLAFLPWLESCCVEKAEGSTHVFISNSKLSIPRVGILPDLSTHSRERTNYDDCSEAHQKLPSTRSSQRRNGELLWEDFMVLINSTLELAFLTQWCLGSEVTRGCSEECLPIEVVLAHNACWLMRTDSASGALGRHETIKHALAKFSRRPQRVGHDLVGGGGGGETAGVETDFSCWTTIMATISPVAKNLAECMRRPLSESADERNQYRLPGQSGLHALIGNVAALKSLRQRLVRHHNAPSYR